MKVKRVINPEGMSNGCIILKELKQRHKEMPAFCFLLCPQGVSGPAVTAQAQKWSLARLTYWVFISISKQETKSWAFSLTLLSHSRQTWPHLFSVTRLPVTWSVCRAAALSHTHTWLWEWERAMAARLHMARLGKESEKKKNTLGFQEIEVEHNCRAGRS